MIRLSRIDPCASLPQRAQARYSLEGIAAVTAPLDPEIRRVFAEVWQTENGTEAPALSEETVLLETGLDSLGFAIFVSQLEDELGFDPFTLAEDAYYPQTFAEFVAFYEKYRPRAA